MSVGADNSGAFLEYVTRYVEGDVPHIAKKFNTKTQKNEDVVTKLQDPVIVFMPNRMSIAVLSAKDAERQGFLERPSIVNLKEVADDQSPVGRFKFATDIEERQAAWMEMENHIIARSVSSGGVPLPEDVRYSHDSIFFKKQVMEKT